MSTDQAIRDYVSRHGTHAAAELANRLALSDSLELHWLLADTGTGSAPDLWYAEWPGGHITASLCKLSDAERDLAERIRREIDALEAWQLGDDQPASAEDNGATGAEEPDTDETPAAVRTAREALESAQDDLTRALNTITKASATLATIDEAARQQAPGAQDDADAPDATEPDVLRAVEAGWKLCDTASGLPPDAAQLMCGRWWVPRWGGDALERTLNAMKQNARATAPVEDDVEAWGRTGVQSPSACNVCDPKPEACPKTPARSPHNHEPGERTT